MSANELRRQRWAASEAQDAADARAAFAAKSPDERLMEAFRMMVLTVAEIVRTSPTREAAVARLTSEPPPPSLSHIWRRLHPP